MNMLDLRFPGFPNSYNWKENNIYPIDFHPRIQIECLKAQLILGQSLGL